jgi:hypothetical protein
MPAHRAAALCHGGFLPPATEGSPRLPDDPAAARIAQPIQMATHRSTSRRFRRYGVRQDFSKVAVPACRRSRDARKPSLHTQSYSVILNTTFRHVEV